MISWLIGIAIVVLIWGALWQRNYVFAFGVLLGLPLAWLLSVFIRPYVTGMEHVPLWLPPLPFACVAILLLVFGVMTWVRADRLPPAPSTDDEHEAGHGH